MESKLAHQIKEGGDVWWVTAKLFFNKHAVVKRMHQMACTIYIPHISSSNTPAAWAASASTCTGFASPVARRNARTSSWLKHFLVVSTWLHQARNIRPLLRVQKVVSTVLLDLVRAVHTLHCTHSASMTTILLTQNSSSISKLLG